uniref:Uncharacterized protein n=2 Tax=Arabidopsis thaliana TaxID=3702 RepID=Q1G3L4_ARATH|nr:unknown protein [Arabidopsis thaliana]
MQLKNHLRRGNKNITSCLKVSRPNLNPHQGKMQKSRLGVLSNTWRVFHQQKNFDSGLSSTKMAYQVK